VLRRVLAVAVVVVLAVIVLGAAGGPELAARLDRIAAQLHH
jgi:hypothetical protein